MLAEYRFLLSRRWLGLLAAAIVVALTCAALGRWQLHRLHARHLRNAVINHNLTSTPVPPQQLMAVGRSLPTSMQWRQVRATGHYDVAHELLVRNRTFEGAVGFHVLTPLVTDAGPALLVDRGWVPVGETATTRPDVPEPPAGTVTVIGRLRQSEPRQGGTPPHGQVNRISTRAISKTLPYPVYGGYAELVSQQPTPRNTPQALPPPEPSEGPHLAYAFQWFLFGSMALGGYVVLARREARDARGANPSRVAVRTEG